MEMIVAMIIVITVITLAVKMQLGAMKDLNEVSSSTLNRVGYKSAVSFHILNVDDEFGEMSEEESDRFDKDAEGWPEDIPKPDSMEFLDHDYILDVDSGGCEPRIDGAKTNYLPIPFREHDGNSQDYLWLCVGDLSQEKSQEDVDVTHGAAA